jgi:hypothetical protein
MAPDPGTLVWYACYGSNCARDRFLVYLTGGRAEGADHDHEGARNDAPPIADGPVVFGTNICFAGHSARWNGAPAFLEHRPDIHAQENRIRPGALEFPDNILDLAPGHQQTVVDGAYGAVVALDPVDGHPTFTFTAPTPPEQRPPAPPSAPYLATILHGLRESHDLDDNLIVERVGHAPGVRPNWSSAAMHQLLDTPLSGISST